jgi:hypothetical protein
MSTAGSIQRRLWHRAESRGGDCGLWSNSGWNELLDSEELLGTRMGREGLLQGATWSWCRRGTVWYSHGGLLPHQNFLNQHQKNLLQGWALSVVRHSCFSRFCSQACGLVCLSTQENHKSCVVYVFVWMTIKASAPWCLNCMFD